MRPAGNQLFAVNGSMICGTSVILRTGIPGSDLLLRGRSGLKPTADLARAPKNLKVAFAALDRVTATLDFQRVTEIHIVADPDRAGAGICVVGQSRRLSDSRHHAHRFNWRVRRFSCST